MIIAAKLVFASLVALLVFGIPLSSAVADDPPPHIHAAKAPALNPIFARQAWVNAGLQRHPILACIRRNESGGNYQIEGDLRFPQHSFGAWQFQPGTANSTALQGGRPELVGVRTNTLSQLDQDWLAVTLADWKGYKPWSTWRKCR